MVGQKQKMKMEINIIIINQQDKVNGKDQQYLNIIIQVEGVLQTFCVNVESGYYSSYRCYQPLNQNRLSTTSIATDNTSHAATPIRSNPALAIFKRNNEKTVNTSIIIPYDNM